MDRSEIISYLISTIREIVEAMGDQVDELDETTKPIGGLASFDSLTGVTLTADCFNRFSLDDSKGPSIINICVGERNGNACALSIGEIADRILQLVNKGA